MPPPIWPSPPTPGVPLPHLRLRRQIDNSLHLWATPTTSSASNFNLIIFGSFDKTKGFDVNYLFCCFLQLRWPLYDLGCFHLTLSISSSVASMGFSSLIIWDALMCFDGSYQVLPLREAHRLWHIGQHFADSGDNRRSKFWKCTFAVSGHCLWLLYAKSFWKKPSQKTTFSIVLAQNGDSNNLKGRSIAA